MKRLRMVMALCAIALVMMGCSNDETSELEQGIEALENEQEDEAREHFEDASEDDADEANAYLELMDDAASVNESMEEDDVEAAIDTYEKMEENEKHPLVTFIFADEEDKLMQALDERKDIDEKINALVAFFDPEDPEMTAHELFLLKSGDLLEQDFITSEQEEAIKEFQEAVEQRMEELADGNENEQENPEQESTEKEEQDEDKDTPSEGNENPEVDEEEGEDGQASGDSESDKLSHEEAKDAVYEFLYGDGAGSDESEDSNFHLKYDHDDGDQYVFHYYESVDDGGGEGHTATLGWYAVDSNTGEVTDIMQ